ncbi:MAG: hypothetical protein R3A13_01860 [Bdellovibrionota bacterium]
MNILIVDKTTEIQATLASKVKSLTAESLDQLDVSLSLAGTNNYAAKLNQTDVLILGPESAVEAVSLIRIAASRDSNIHIILYVKDADYSELFLKEVYSAGAHKVLLDSSSSMDLYQELLLVDSKNYKSGKNSLGKLIAITSAKGGVGVTSFAAGLAEVCNDHGRTTLLWDLDFESRDLSRGLLAFDDRAEIVNDWVTGRKILKNKTSLLEALIPIANNANLLVPPSGMAEGMDLSCHTEGLKLISRIIELSRLTHQITIVDLSGITGPAKGAIIRLADHVIALTGDCTFGYTSLHFYLDYIKNLLGDLSRLKILKTNRVKTLDELRQIVDPERTFPDSVWTLPILANDSSAKNWAGSHKTIFSKGSNATRSAMIEIASQLALIDSKVDSTEIKSKISKVKSIFGNYSGRNPGALNFFSAS